MPTPEKINSTHFYLKNYCESNAAVNFWFRKKVFAQFQFECPLAHLSLISQSWSAWLQTILKWAQTILKHNFICRPVNNDTKLLQTCTPNYDRIRTSSLGHPAQKFTFTVIDFEVGFSFLNSQNIFLHDFFIVLLAQCGLTWLAWTTMNYIISLFYRIGSVSTPC